MANENIGMMDGAFFVSKGELISWVNDTLNLHISKVEHMASGAAYCQLIDMLFPGSIPMSKINWMAKYDHEFVWNYRFLQIAFEKNNVHKHIEVDKLIKSKYQDNLEFLQWFKRFFDLNSGNLSDYNPLEKRKNAKTPWDTEKSAKVAEKIKVSSPRNTAYISPRVQSPKSIPVSPSSKAKVEQERVEKLESMLKEARESIQHLEKEKAFYYGKLRNIEVYCDHHESEGNNAISDVQKILFAGETDVVSISDNGSVMFG